MRVSSLGVANLHGAVNPAAVASRATTDTISTPLKADVFVKTGAVSFGYSE